MMKVLIVDDEIFVISLIQKIINWEKLGMTIVGTADNGLTALQLVNELQPDIVIVDVNMPEYDGITLMQKVRELNNKVKFIVISGHKRFEYAKSAMKYNVEDYLLKPISKDELETILLKLKEKLETEEKQKSTMENLDNQLGDIKKKVQNYFMEQLTSFKIEWKEQNIDEINRKYYTNFQENMYQCFIVKLDSKDKELNESFLTELLNKIAENIKGEIKKYCNELIYAINGYRIIFFINFKNQNQSKLKQAIEEAKEKVDKSLLKFEKLIITLGLGDSVTQIDLSYDSLKSANMLIDSRICLGVGAILTKDKVKEDKGILNIVLSDQRKEKLLIAIKKFEISKIKPLILEVFSRAEEYEKTDSKIHVKIIDELNHMFYDYMSQIDVYKGTYEELYENIRGLLEECMTSKEVAIALVHHMSTYINRYIEDNENDESPAVRIAKRYIIENYQKEISLSSISEIVNLSSVYFSILFKKEVGINFLDYLNQYRIDISKKLLKDVKYNVNEVANLVGFNNARYFSKKFKKIVGITPTEYRMRHVER
ncbi:MAG: response regulator transcription factor [bacterium]